MKRWLTFTGSFLYAATFILSGMLSAEPLPTNIDHRVIYSLNGSWNIIIDPYEIGFYDYRYRENPNGYMKNTKAKDKSDLVEYDFDKSPTLQVPGDWNSQRNDLLFYEGTVWYKRSFDCAKTEGKRIFVYFGAANYEAHVYLNGEKLGQHAGGFTPFCFEITDKVRAQDNFLIVKVDNKRYREAVPTVNTDWWNYGGLTRRVLLIETPATFIRDSFLQLEKGSMERLTGWVQLDGAELEQTVSIEIPEAKVKQEVKTDASGRAEFTIDGKLALWTPENPKLYDVVITAGEDRLSDRIGFRSITTSGHDILLNGKPIFLRGICIHEESPLGTGRATGKDDALVLLSWAKELGCNFVRLAHYPHNEAMIRTADEMGLLVWSEIPVYWTIEFGNEETYRNAENQLAEMITRDKNRASIILWSVANETPVNEMRLAFLRKLIDKTRSLDNTRLLTAAMEKTTRDSVIHIDDPLAAYLDVLGCNEYVGWYDGTPQKCQNYTWETKYEKPLIMSEFGGGALQGYHADKETRFSEEYLVELYRCQLQMLDKIDFLRGTTPWILKDFPSPRRPLAGIQDYYNRKGLISNRGQRKDAFYVVQAFYKEKAQEAAGK
ncbi:MAG: hypothetical protein LLF76_05665 [Planctomycetaceae bacterium]|nr:hypothetical protein [Planctomycetaceae bacterium]